MTRRDHDRHAIEEELAMARAEIRTETADFRKQIHDDVMAAFAAQKRTLVPCLVITCLLIAVSNVVAILIA